MKNGTSDTHAMINDLMLNALASPNRQSLANYIVNATRRLVDYNHAILWDIELYNPTVLAISNENLEIQHLEVSKSILNLVFQIKEKDEIHVLLDNDQKASLLWIPIPIEHRATLGLLLERSNEQKWSDQEIEMLKLITEGYGYAWKSLYPQWTLSFFQKIRWGATALVCLIILSIIPISSHVHAPCRIDGKKIIIQIPKGFQVLISSDRPVEIIFTGEKEKYEAYIVDVTADSHLADGRASSFSAEAVLAKQPAKDLQQGLKGTAVFYGQNISLIYWLVQVPFRGISI